MEPSALSTAHDNLVASLLPTDRLAPQFSPKSAKAFARRLNQTTNICSSRNIQLCKNCIVNYILPSPGRTAALFKYLLALSKSCKPRPAASNLSHSSAGPGEHDGLEPINGQIIPQKSAYKRLHIVYLLHDVLVTFHHWQSSGEAPAPYKSLDLRFILGMLREQLTRLFRLAACRGDFGADEVGQQLSSLVAHWENFKLFSNEELETLRNVARTARERNWDQVMEECSVEDHRRVTEQRQAEEEANRWHIPLRHGVKDDPDAPWYELPAANGLYMKHTRGYPLRASAYPRGGYQVKNGGQEADLELQKDVTWLHKEMLHCFDEYTNAEDIQDIDPLGNKVWKDPDRPTRNYWGFTYDGIDKIRENSKKFRSSATGYDDVAPLMSDPNSMDDVDSAVARARALAGGRGGGFDRGGGRGGRGGRGSWRGPPRGGNGGFRGDFRGGRGGPHGRF